ncbi:Solute carrier organic anion transporter family member 1C1 [Chionoecetes opilio]|uniref:Solute carrier organic anion transporter family member 1C1 n=1 Tax=Chionoecetes opilio TaxID=41210 RepID=A0A8J4YJ98_CHIOP|nr:Solute carrier organic anion transporter family member 1C1 [Chionoecetes opilio]
MYYTIGHTYLDDAVSKDKVPLFLGYLVIGGCLGVEAWLLALLPRTLPGTRRRGLRELRQAATRGGVRAVQELATTLRPAHHTGLRGLVGGLGRLARNKVYVLVVVNQAFFWFAFIGYITFKPKFLEHQFKMSAARANQYIAAAAMAATLAGWLMTGATLSLLRPRSRTVLIFMACLSLTNGILHLSMVNVSCEREVIHGMDTVLQEGGVPASRPHNASTSLDGEVTLRQCVAGCGCPPKFSPVCVEGRDTFYSACHAGCSSVTSPFTSSNTTTTTTTANTAAKKQHLSASPSAASSPLSVSPSAVDGYCSHECPAFYMYLALTVLTKMTLAASRVPVNIMLFRCVEPRDKDLGLGVFNSVLALAAFIPAPLVFGWAIDAACRLWEESCGGRGSCWLYDIDAFRKILHGIPASLMALCLLTELLLIFFHKSIHLYGPPEGTSKAQ